MSTMERISRSICGFGQRRVRHAVLGTKTWLLGAIKHDPGREAEPGVWIVTRSKSLWVPISACCMASTTCWTGCARTRCGPRRAIRAPDAPAGK